MNAPKRQPTPRPVGKTSPAGRVSSRPAIKVVPYTESLCSVWNRLVAQSRNGTFLFDRGFMDYHADRFEDASLCFFVDDKCVALLPANRVGDTVFSHAGLTYGGFILRANYSSSRRLMTMVDALIEYLRISGVKRLVYKPVPHIFHRRPSEEALYALFRAGARVSEREIWSAVPPPVTPVAPIQLARRRRDLLRKALELDGLEIGASDAWDIYWALLTDRMAARFDEKPVHSLAEIKMLAARFPKNIWLMTATIGGDVTTGIVLFETETALHTQYSVASDLTHANDAVLFKAMEHAQRAAKWFSLGTSTADHESGLNSGVIHYKESFGAGGLVHDTYTLDL